jgi:uncharacterized protein (TIGR00251 family)
LKTPDESPGTADGPLPWTVLSVAVHPGARREEIGTFSGERLKISVFAPPEKGKANKAAVALLARHLGLPRSRLRIVRGETARRKDIRIEGLSAEALYARLRSPGAER